jgi:hypothetical protein
MEGKFAYADHRVLFERFWLGMDKGLRKKSCVSLTDLAFLQ